ncbi:hypothetical protein ACFQ5F_01560 [Kroppenstedtia eburnea]|uniref:hypothetical protein n=1 Tax=Kroppenstedtia eburnea TaxID=714067 RepID=UPI0036337F71
MAQHFPSQTSRLGREVVWMFLLLYTVSVAFCYDRKEVIHPIPILFDHPRDYDFFFPLNFFLFNFSSFNFFSLNLPITSKLNQKSGGINEQKSMKMVPGVSEKVVFPVIVINNRMINTMESILSIPLIKYVPGEEMSYLLIHFKRRYTK